MNTSFGMITKNSGDRVPFDINKLKQSLRMSGASEQLITEICSEIQLIFYDRIPTKEIYKKAFHLLKKNAIMELGPTGYPFEKFVSGLLKYEGYKTQVGVLVKGLCVTHEIDVIAEKDNQHFMIECKFHAEPGRVCNVKIPLYIQSRFKDVESQWEKIPGHQIKFHQGWVVNNTRFSADAIAYGECAGLHLVSWNHPEQGSLKERIDRSGLHPITCLTTLKKNEKKLYLDTGNVLCTELCHQPSLLYDILVPEERHKEILNEAHELCGMKHAK